MRQRSELAKPPLRASEAEPTVNSSESTALAPIALPSLLSTSREWSCGVPKQHVEQGHLQLRLPAGKQDQNQQVEASRRNSNVRWPVSHRVADRRWTSPRVCRAKVDFACHVFSLYLFLPIIIFDPVLTIFSMSSRATPDLRIAP